MAKKTKNQKNSKQPKKEKETESKHHLTIEEEKNSFEELNKKYDEKKIEVQNLSKTFDQAQFKKALAALTKIIDEKYDKTISVLTTKQDEFFYVNFIIDKLPKKFSIRPLNVELPHSIYGENFNTSVCLFVKDPKSEFKDLQIEFPFRVKVIDISKLKLKYERFEERRKLLKQYEIFLCDIRLYYVLRKLLGKPFYHANKFPLPVKLNYEDKENIKAEIERNVFKCTHFRITRGPTYAVKFARATMSQKEKIENLNSAIIGALPHILKYDTDVSELKTISVKCANTIELPIYNFLKEEEIKKYLDKK